MRLSVTSVVFSTMPDQVWTLAKARMKRALRERGGNLSEVAFQDLGECLGGEEERDALGVPWPPHHHLLASVDVEEP